MIGPSQPQLRSTETEGSAFYVNGGNYLAVLSNFTSGTCNLEAKAPDGTWVKTGVSFTANGYQHFYATQMLEYRFKIETGTAGMQAWAIPAYSQGAF